MEQDLGGVSGIRPDPTLQEEDYRRHLYDLNESKPTVTEFLHAQPRAVFEPVVVKKEMVYRDVYVREPASLIERVRNILRIIYITVEFIVFVAFSIFILYWMIMLSWFVLLFVWDIYR